MGASLFFTFISKTYYIIKVIQITFDCNFYLVFPEILIHDLLVILFSKFLKK